MKSVLLNIKETVAEWATLDVDSEMNDRDKFPQGAYWPVEHELLRLAQVSEVAPRANQEYTLAVEKAPALKRADSQPPTTGGDNPAKSASSKVRGWLMFSDIAPLFSPPPPPPPPLWKQKRYWAAGTGYGHAGQSKWDPAAYRAAQLEKDRQVQNVVERLTHLLETCQSDAEALLPILEGSALVPFLQSYLATESMLEMERHKKLYAELKRMILILASVAPWQGLFRLVAAHKHLVLSFL